MRQEGNKMKSFFYPRLALTNLKKNSKLYFPYLLTSSFTVMMFYLINYLASHKGLEQMATGSSTMQIILNLGIIVMVIFSVIFLFYMNSFLMKRRKKEIALYNILGLEKKHIMIMMLCETIITTLISFVMGFLFGIIFSQLVSLVLIHLMGLSTTLTFHISWSSFLVTVIVFLPIYLASYLIHVIQIQLSNPIELLRGSQSGEKEPKTKWLMTIIGLVTLGLGYYIAITIDDPTTAILLFFVAVILVIIGTYCLFTAGSITILKLLKKNKHFYYQTKHFTSVSQLIYRMKQNAVGLASICILCTCILVMLSSTVSLYFGIEDTIKAYQQDSFQLKVYGYDDGTLPSDQEFAKFYSQMQTELENHDIGIDSFIHTKRYSVSVRFGNDHILAEDESGDFVVGYLVGMTQDEYNRAYHQNVQLSGQNILVSSNFFDFGDTLDIDQQKYPIQEVVHQPYLLPNENPTAQRNLIVIMKDEEAIQEMMSYFFGDTIQPTENLSIVYQDQSQEKEAVDILRKCLDNFSLETETEQGGISFYRSSLYEVRIMLMELYGSLFFLGIFLGILFLMATILIMYYKQLSEGYEDKKRFEIMQKVGMSTKEVKQTIRSQVLIFFFLPLIASVIHMAFAFHLITMMFSYIVLSGTEVFITCTIISVIIVAIVYAIVYVFTSRTYYRIVKN